MAARRGGESLLEEMSLSDGEFGVSGRAQTDKPREGQLTRTYMPIAVRAIVGDSPFQTRQVAFDPDQITEDAELLESVRRHGVLEPVYVEWLPSELGADTQYRLVSGHRRLAAARAVGQEHIPGIVANKSDDLQALNMAENAGHRHLLPYEKAIALVERRKSEPGLSLRGLAKVTGIPFGTTSDLVAAYEKSPPALRRLFSEGVAARTIIELQPVFRTLDEDHQVAAADMLHSVSISQAQSFRQLVEGGVEPEAAARSATGLTTLHENNSPATDPSPRKKGKHPARSAGRGSEAAASRSSAKAHPDDEGDLQALCERTGVSSEVGRRLTREAIETGADYEALTFAAVYLARGGDKKTALSIAMQARKKRRLASILRGHVRHLERARGLIARQEDHEMADFLRTVFFGA